ncbi:MAG: GGDEF domain-containing protein [Cellulosilyticaceae bacterium]
MERHNIDKLNNAIEYMKPFFDVVRLVDTKETKVITFESPHDRTYEANHCYHVWNKDKRCENCISMNAVLTQEQKEKYEFRDDEVYHVISRPIKVVDEQKEEHEFVLEIVNGVADQSIFEKFGMSDTDDKTIIQLIAETYRKIYEDPLTGAYNRRFLDEFRFLYHNHNQVAKKVAFIMVDLKKFKEINDTMGHEIGDRLLAEVADILKQNIGIQDSVIRMGGDEFLIVLGDCEEAEVHTKMDKIHKQIKAIPLHREIDIDWGHAYTESFEISKAYMDRMIKQADQAMYTMKKSERGIH